MQIIMAISNVINTREPTILMVKEAHTNDLIEADNFLPTMVTGSFSETACSCYESDCSCCDFFLLMLSGFLLKL